MLLLNGFVGSLPKPVMEKPVAVCCWNPAEEEDQALMALKDVRRVRSVSHCR